MVENWLYNRLRSPRWLHILTKYQQPGRHGVPPGNQNEPSYIPLIHGHQLMVKLPENKNFLPQMSRLVFPGGTDSRGINLKKWQADVHLILKHSPLLCYPNTDQNVLHFSAHIFKKIEWESSEKKKKELVWDDYFIRFINWKTLGTDKNLGDL